MNPSSPLVFARWRGTKPSPLSVIRPICFSLFFGALASRPMAFGRERSSPPSTVGALERRVEEILAATGTPGAAVAIIDRQGEVWMAGIGIADVAHHRPANADTLFPIGSTSKMFVALSVLKLRQEGKLSLDDTLRARAPEVRFDNPWEATDPVRIVHLLEHTAGWDDRPLPPLPFQPEREPTRGEFLSEDARSRTSRWKPGTCHSYSNWGPGAVARVVEDVTGQPFENYVAQNWFRPLGMSGATYSVTGQSHENVAVCYPAGSAGSTPRFHPVMRPSGGVFASARDMAELIQIFLDRGSIHGARLLPPDAIDRMEQPASTYAARNGLKVGYGLCNVATARGSWIFHGHGGAVPGALSSFAYLPEQHLGYAMMINSENSTAQEQIERAIRGYLLRDVAAPRAPPPAHVDQAHRSAYSGWYVPFTPRNERDGYLEAILGVAQVGFTNGRLTVRFLNGTFDYVPCSAQLYRRTDQASPTLAFIDATSDGMLLQRSDGHTFRRLTMPMSLLFGGGAILTVALMLGSMTFGAFWISQYLLGAQKEIPHVFVRTGPLFASISAIAAFGLIWYCSGNYFARPPLWSGGWVTTSYYLVFAAFVHFSIRGLIRVVNRRAGIPRLIWWHAFTLSLTLSICSVYLAYWGLRSEFFS